MKVLIFILLLLSFGLCVAQDTEPDYPAGIRIMFADGTSTQLSCTQDGNCSVVRNTATSPTITRINLGFKAKHGYVLTVQQ